MSDFQYIDTNAALAELCQRWMGQAFVAIDTEFIRRDTFYPIAGLLQLGAEGQCVLVDPLEIDDWQPLIALLTHPEVVKVIHSCSEDLEVFQRLLGCVPKPLLDTQIGAALAGWGFGLSYQNLVLHGLGLYVDKGETRSDWLQRPLTTSQCEYAALDVLYLQRIYPKLCQVLENEGRLDWWQQECEQIIAQAENPVGPDQYYRRLKNEFKLRPRQRVALKLLCEWREHQARERDIPRGRVMKDPVCFDIAARQPKDVNGLHRIKQISTSLVRRQGEEILALLEQANDQHEIDLPPVVYPLNTQQKRQAKKLREFCQSLLEPQGLPVELLLRRRDLDALVRDRALPAGLLDWRREVIGEALLKHLSALADKEQEQELDPSHPMKEGAQ